MAATKFLALAFYITFLNFTSNLQGFSRVYFKLSSSSTHLRRYGTEREREMIYSRVSQFQLVVSVRSSRHFRIRKPITAWSKHGYLLLASRDDLVCIDITVFMDVEKNPGPVLEDNLTEALSTRISYSKNELVSLRKEAIKPASDVFESSSTEAVALEK